MNKSNIMRILSIRGIVIILTIICYAVSNAYDFEKDGLYYNILSEDKLTVECCGGGQSPTDATYRKTDIEIPSHIQYGTKTYSVVKIADYAWGKVQYVVWIKNITIPETITEIGEGAFRDANNIESINLPEGLKSIGDYALQGPKITEYIFPTSLEKIGSQVFSRKLTTAIFTSSEAPEIHPEAFAYKANGVGNIVIPSELLIYVPTITAYSSITAYKAYMIPICNFQNLEYTYSGEQPSLEYDINLPDNYTLNIKIEEMPISAGHYNIIQSGTINEIYSINIPINLVINKAPLDIFIHDYDRIYGAENPIFSAEIYGLQNEDSIDDALQEGYEIITTATQYSNIGEYAITLSSFKSQNYTLNFKPGVLKIEPALLKISIGNYSREYGIDNPDFHLRYEGLQNNESSPFWDKEPIFTTDASKVSDIGRYSISVECAAHNYEIVSVNNGAIVITKAPLVLVASDKSRLYFEDNPPFDYELLGLRNSDTKGSLALAPTFSCSAVKTSNTGMYEITPSNTTATNYDITYKNGTLSIDKRRLIVSVGNYVRSYNTDNPVFAVSYEGFVNNEDSSVLSQQPSVSCTATKTSNVGSYILTPKGGEAENYIITQYHNGVLTIEKADQTIIWNQDLSNVDKNSQIALTAISDADLDITYDMSPNNVATLYNNAGVHYLDCYGSGAVNIRAIQNGNKNYNAAPFIEKTLVVNGIEEDPSVPQIYLNVKIAGSLPSMIAENRKYEIESLRLSGNLNGTDLRYIREMAGSDIYGDPTSGHLQVLDLSECKIVSGGEPYFHTTYGTSSNVIGEHMFYNCKSLVTLHLPNNITSLEDYAIAGCDALTIVSLPSTLEYIRSYAFHDDINLLRIHLPNKIRSIGDMAFSGCIQLTELTIPQNVKYIGEGILSRCQNIIQINVEDNPNYMCLDGVLFSKSLDKLLIYPANYSLDEYSIPEGVKGIASYAFLDAKNLKSISLPKTLKSIGSDVFLGCINLSSLTVLALDPPICANNCFDRVNKTHCQLIVPKGCYSYYWVAPVWAEFNNIIEFDDSGIEEISDINFSITSESNTITIVGLPINTHIFIFRSDGILVHDSKTRGEEYKYTFNGSGTYIIAFEDKTYKMFIK